MSKFNRFRMIAPKGIEDVPQDTLHVMAYDLARFVLRDMIKTHFADDSCAATAGFTVDILEELGVKVEAVPCHVICLNKTYLEWSNKEGSLLPQSGKDAKRLHRRGGRIVIMTGAHPNRDDVKTLAGAFAHFSKPDDKTDEYKTFPGHVVVIARTALKDFLIDLSIDQTQAEHRPGITAEPIVLPVDGRFTEEGDAIAIFNNETLTLYERISDQSFRQSPDFTRKREDDPDFEALLVEVKAAMTYFLLSVSRALATTTVVRSVPSSLVAHEVETGLDGFGTKQMVRQIMRDNPPAETAVEEEAEEEAA